MLHKLEDAFDRALDDGYKGLWATGDMTWEFGDKKNFPRLLEYEWKLEELFKRRPELHGVCQYHHDTLPPDFMRKGLLAHKTLFVNETLSILNPHYLESRLSAEQAAANSDLDRVIDKICQSQVVA
jgi:hypothetical protein